MARRQRPSLVVCVADLHFNSVAALCPPSVLCDDGGTYTPNKAQVWLWECWLDLWARVKAIKAQERARRVITVVVGDLVDDNTHSKAQLIALLKPTILRGAVQVLDPLLAASDVLYVVRGTEAHGGPSSELEELLAEDVGAVGDGALGTFSHWFLPLEVDGVRFDIAHHPATSSHRPWTRTAATARQAQIVRRQYQDRGDQPPDVVVRAHVHYGDASGRYPPPQAVQCHPWQLTTAYGHRLGAGAHIEPPGAWVFVCENGQHRLLDPIEYKPKRRGFWRI